MTTWCPSALLKLTGFAVAVAVLDLLPAFDVLAGPPTVNDLTVSDITPRSFSVLWTTSEPSTAGLRVFRGPACTEPVSDATMTAHPTISGDPAVRQAAELNGVMKVRASGFSADTEYCVQTLTTSKSTQEQAVVPATPARVRTARAVTRTRRADPSGPLLPFSNDLIRFSTLQPDQATAATGALVLVSAPGAQAPVSGFVGDGIAPPDALLDLNNLFGAGSLESVRLAGGEVLVIRQLRGLQGGTLVRFRELPSNGDLAELKDPTACFSADLDCSGTVNVVDFQRLLNRWQTRTGHADFNPDLDVTGDGVVSDPDVGALRDRFGQRRPFGP